MGQAFGDVTVEQLPGFVASVRMRRPPDNFFDAELVQGVADALQHVERQPECRAIVLCSEGRHFCAGARLGPGGPDSHPREIYRQAVRLFTGTKPIVAAVRGAAVGGGLGVALSADFRVASPESRFSANFSQLGFFPGFGLTALLPRVVGEQAALDLLYTGARVDGVRAEAIGLCDRLVEVDEIEGQAVALAGLIAASAPESVRRIRRHLRGDLARQIREATRAELREQVDLLDSEDFAEGVSAMAERRPPRFSGR